MDLGEILNSGVEKEIDSILDIAYNELFEVHKNDPEQNEIFNLTDQEAKNSLQWIEGIFIKHFELKEEYEKCQFLKQLSNQIKIIKQIK